MLWAEPPKLKANETELLNYILEYADSAIAEINDANYASAGILLQWIIDVRGELYKRMEKKNNAIH